MPKEEFKYEVPKFNGPDNGGDLTTFTEDADAIVAFTKYGEMSCEITGSQGLLVDFPEMGMTFLYNVEGILEMASMDIEPYLRTYLDSLTKKEVESLPNKGKNIEGIIQSLEDYDFSMGLYLTMATGKFEVLLIDAEGQTEIVEQRENQDLTRGLQGTLGVLEGKYQLAFEVTDSGDGLFMFVGETDETSINPVTVEISHNVDFENLFYSDDPKRFQKIAAKIILG